MALTRKDIVDRDHLKVNFNAANLLIRRYMTARYEISKDELDMLFWLVNYSMFTKEDFYSSCMVMRQNRYAWDKMVRKEYIKPIKKDAHMKYKQRYTVAVKWKQLMTWVMKVQVGLEPIPEAEKNPVMKAYYNHKEGEKKNSRYYLGKRIIEYNRFMQKYGPSPGNFI